MRLAALVLLAGLLPSVALADERPAAKVTVSGAWTPPADRGADVPLYMTIRGSDAADALVRARCDAANFVELQTVDEGEGFPNNRVVKSIPVGAQGTTELRKDRFHVMLLQTRQALAPGATFSCGLTFNVSGKMDVEVTVRDPE
jgi:copper(I)-binding protein